MIHVLDHGEVELVEVLASDQMVLKAMLVSTGKDVQDDFQFTCKKPDPRIVFNGDIDDYMYDEVIKRNRGRINFLMREHHGTPFEHNAFIFRVKLPIFVAREWHRHRIGWSYNEISGRYTKLPDQWYVPELDNVRMRVGKPGAYTYEPAPEEWAIAYRNKLKHECVNCYDNYEWALNHNIAPEQARLFLHVNHYTSMYATCNARSLMHFLNLRAAPTAQQEIQAYAGALEVFFVKHMPVTYEAFCDNGRVAP